MFCRAIPYEGEEPYIFVSYCHGDKGRVYPILEQLALDGYRAWYDVGNQPGQNWLENIETHLENCRAVIAFISQRSSDSNNCNKEIIYAMKCGKKVVPVLIEEAALPRGLRMQLVDLHYLERRNFPTDQALLKKCYETEELAACRSAAGAIPLRPVEISGQENNRQPENRQDNAIAGMQQVRVFRKKKVQKERYVDKTVAPPPQEPPVHQPPQPEEPQEPIHQEEETRVPIHLEEETEKTVLIPEENTETGDYGQMEEEKTVLVDGGVTEEDPTVCVSRNLAILLHLRQGVAYKVRSPQITLGRSRIRCDVAIEGNASISKVHAIIRQTNRCCYIEDANSSNGTYVCGQPIAPGQQMPLENPGIFQLYDETMILISGPLARTLERQGTAVLLLNEGGTAARVLEGDSLPLNRNNKWPDGTLTDGKIHRANHARLTRQGEDVYLVDESPERSNGTYLNGSRLARGESRCLTSGDRIRLGDTSLKFISIEIPS